MKKVFRANLYFLIILLLEIILPRYLAKIWIATGLTDMRFVLVANHLIIFLIPAAIYIFITKSRVKDVFKLNSITFKEIGMIFLLSIVARPAMTLFSLITAMFFENNVAQMLDTISATPYGVLVLIIAVLPAITEEVTLRGVILSGYDDKGMIKAALITGVMFGMFHLDGQQFLYATALGFVLALLVRITNSIFSAAFLHFLINATSVTLQQIVLKLPEMGEMAEEVSIKTMPISEKIAMLQVYLIPALISMGLCALILMKMKKWRDEKKGTYMPLMSSNPKVNKFFGLTETKNENLIEANDKVYSKERIVNWPLIGSVLLYVAYMAARIYFESKM